MSAFYKMDPAAWDFGTANLTLEQEAAYLRIVNAIAKHDCGVPNNDRILAGMFRCSTRKARALRDALIEAGKIVVEDGVLWNERARSEMVQRRFASVSASERGAKGGRKRAENAAKALKEKKPPQANASSRIEKNRIDTSLQEDAAASLWGEGLKILLRLGVKERQARTIIGKWRKAHGDGETLKALLVASKANASDPIPYVERVLRGDSRNRPVSDEEHAAAWGMRNANHDGDSGRTADHGRQEPSRRPADDLPGMQQPPQATEPEAALSVGDVQAGRDRGALPSLRLVGGEAF